MLVPRVHLSGLGYSSDDIFKMQAGGIYGGYDSQGAAMGMQIAAQQRAAGITPVTSTGCAPAIPTSGGTVGDSNDPMTKKLAEQAAPYYQHMGDVGQVSWITVGPCPSAANPQTQECPPGKPCEAFMVSNAGQVQAGQPVATAPNWAGAPALTSPLTAGASTLVSTGGVQSFLTGSMIGGVPNWMLLAGAAVALFLLMGRR